MHVLLPSDVFPPRSGGAGWSAHALATALQQRGHQVTALVPRRGAHGLTHTTILGVPAVLRGYRAPGFPFVLNYFRHERLWPLLARDLATLAGRAGQRGVIHAQHVQVTPAAVLAGQAVQWPVVVTVRDHWPWDYFATGLHGDRVAFQGQNWPSLATDLVARLGPIRGVAALAAIPYMLAHVRRRQAFLRRADAVIAVSEYMAGRLRAIVDPARVVVIPNMVDIPAIEQTISQAPGVEAVPGVFLLYVGKLERNKGAHLLPEIMRHLLARSAGTPAHLPALVIAGDGPLRDPIKRDLDALGVRARFLEWIDHDDVLRLMARCDALVYPSAWGEPLTRVLLEAAACGAVAVAMPTGGTADIVEHETTGFLEPTPARMAQRLHELLSQPALKRRMADAARRLARERFGAEAVVGQVEYLYRQVLS